MPCPRRVRIAPLHTAMRPAVLLLAATAAFAASIGPSKGTLVIAGGGRLGPEIVERFIALAGGPDAPMVFIPTAEDGEPRATAENNLLFKAGVKHVAILHTRDRKVADSKEFVAPLRTAHAVWFEGGRQWRLADAYLGTRTEGEIFRLLRRGGAIGGSSAGATIQGSFLVRGAVEGNTVMMSPGHEIGMAFLRNSAIDQHLLTRHRENDLLQVIGRYPKLLGIGLDEGTAIVVHGNRFEVIGKSKVAIYDARYKPQPDGRRYYFLSAGDRFDLKHRRKVQLPAIHATRLR